MARERIGLLEEIACEYPDPDRIVGCARVQRPNGREFYAGFGDVIQVEEDVIALVEDKFRTGRDNFHVVRIPRELTAINLR